MQKMLTGALFVFLLTVTVPLVAAELPTASLPGEGQCPATAPAADWNEQSFRAWAEEAGVELVPRPVEVAAPQCPATHSCQMTHCVETNLCSTQSIGPTCCVGTSCLLCPTGQTVLVTMCRCNGGGCTGPSVSFACG